jgi:hypothetical protein
MRVPVSEQVHDCRSGAIENRSSRHVLADLYSLQAWLRPRGERDGDGQGAAIAHLAPPPPEPVRGLQGSIEVATPMIAPQLREALF